MTTDNISLERANVASSAFDSGAVTDNTVNTYANLFYPHVWDNGGNSEVVSLTIDIFNEDELVNQTETKIETENDPNKNWVAEDRMRDGVIFSPDIWGFRESFHGAKKSRAISNGFCFAGQGLTFYIKPKGHGTGQIDETWLYCKTTLVVTSIDLVNGTSSILEIFDDFEVDQDDSSRYFTWVVPNGDSTVFSSYGLFGINVLRLDIQKAYYMDAEMKVPYVGNAPCKNQANLQLLTYSGSKEIIEVNGGNISILTATPNYSDSLVNIFTDTVFDSLEDLNYNTLSDNQKRAIIADQIAVLFMSQHPVINADIYPGKILGGGVDEAVEPRKVIDRAITYTLKNPSVVPIVNDRLFGMFATYRTYNFTDDLEAVIPDKTQSSQIIRDPVRTILMKSNSVVSSDMGINGVIFDPYALEVINAEFVPSQDLVMSCPLCLNTVDITNIDLAGANGVNFVPYDKKVNISFEVTYGALDIKQIRYSIWTSSALNYDFYIDTTGLTRSHEFTLPPDKPVLIDPVKNGDIITGQIDIEDFNGNIYSFVYTEYAQGYVDYPALMDLKIYQTNTGDRVVNLYYNYVGIEEINNAYMIVEFSIDSGVTWSEVPTTSLKGDYGNNVMPGRRRVTWLPETDLDGLTIDGLVMARLTLYDVDSQKARGNVLTGVLVWDITDPKVAVRRLSLEEELEMEDSSTSSSSDSSSSESSSSSS